MGYLSWFYREDAKVAIRSPKKSPPLSLDRAAFLVRRRNRRHLALQRIANVETGKRPRPVLKESAAFSLFNQKPQFMLDPEGDPDSSEGAQDEDRRFSQATAL